MTSNIMYEILKPSVFRKI